MLDQDKILYFLRATGPTLPTKVAKNIKTEILLASAHLSDLTAQGKVKVSHLKVGGSPLYYLQGQEDQLFSFAQNNLNPKDFQVLENLKAEKILKEANLDLLSKVSLRSLQDFAVPLHVTFNGKTELFWKWHLSTNEEANTKISQLITPIQHEIPPEMVSGIPASLSIEAHLAAAQSVPDVSPLENTAPEILSKAEEKKIVPVEQKTLVEEDRAGEVKSKEKEKKSAKTKRTLIEDTFYPTIEHFLKKLEITIEQKELLRKNAEMNFVVRVPSVVGKMTYFCKAKKKGKCDEKDLSSAYMEAQVKKLPLLFLYSEELSKKAEEMLNSGAFENVVAKRIK